MVFSLNTTAFVVWIPKVVFEDFFLKEGNYLPLYKSVHKKGNYCRDK